MIILFLETAKLFYKVNVLVCTYPTINESSMLLKPVQLFVVFRMIAVVIGMVVSQQF